MSFRESGAFRRISLELEKGLNRRIVGARQGLPGGPLFAETEFRTSKGKLGANRTTLAGDGETSS